MRRAWAIVLLLAAVLALSPVSAANAAKPAKPGKPANSTTTTNGCKAGAPEAWFVGIVYDEERRDDFVADLDHFEAYRDHLRNKYCLPATQTKLLAFEGQDGYPAGSEANLKQALGEVRQGIVAGDTLFFFLSSHGLMWSGAVAESCPPDRLAGSFSGLRDGGGENGQFEDCELGDELAAIDAEVVGGVPMFVAVDCSFCGGFSDSLTAVSGTIPDGGVPSSSGVPAPGRVVVTGCAITTECFGSTDGGGNFYESLTASMSVGACDGWTAPGFPQLQGIDLPVRGATDTRCTASEWFFAAVQHAYTTVASPNWVLSVQQQYRIKYGFHSLDQDIVIS